MPTLDYKIFDADNHYYEVEDTFTRFGDEKVRRHVRWVQEGKRRHIMFGNRMSTGVSVTDMGNPPFAWAWNPDLISRDLHATWSAGLRRPPGPRFGSILALQPSPTLLRSWEHDRSNLPNG